MLSIHTNGAAIIAIGAFATVEPQKCCISKTGRPIVGRLLGTNDPFTRHGVQDHCLHKPVSIIFNIHQNSSAEFGFEFTRQLTSNFCQFLLGIEFLEPNPAGGVCRGMCLQGHSEPLPSLHSPCQQCQQCQQCQPQHAKCLR